MSNTADDLRKGRLPHAAFRSHQRSTVSPAAVAGIKHRVRTGRYRVAPERIAHTILRGAGLA
jgi:anti-sigma28 factor (negative regulator of flagellin synthesis)